MYQLVPPRSVLVALALVVMLAGGMAWEGCRYVARHVRIGWQP